MYLIGNNQGRAYNSTEGKGASEYLSMPLTAQAEQDVAKLNFNFKLQKQKDQEANQSDYYKTLESVKPEGYFLDRQELSDKYNALVDKGSQLMQKGIVNPFASGDPEAIALQKELFQLKQDVDDSKGMETDYNVSRNQLATGDESVWDKKSLEEWKKYYDTPQSERKKNKMLPPKLKKANPYANVTKAVNEQWGNFVKLQKDAGGAITPDMKDRFVENMMNPDNMKAGLEQYAKEMFDGMSDVEKKKLIPLFGKDYNGQLDAVAVTKAVVKNIVENQLFPNISLDANEYFTKTGEGIMDITTQTDAGGVHKVTMVNYGKDREELAKVAESKALFDINTNANLANTLARRYGITETDTATRNRLIAKKAAEDIMATKDKQMKIDNTKPTSVNINMGGANGNSDGAAFIKQLKVATASNTSDDPSFGVLKNALRLGEGRTITNIKPYKDPNDFIFDMTSGKVGSAGQGSNKIAVYYNDIVTDSQGTRNVAVKEPLIMDINDPSIQAEILGQYQQHTAEKKGNKFSTIKSDINNATGTFDNFKPNASQKSSPKESKSVGKTNAW